MIKPALGRVVWFTPAQSDSMPTDEGKCVGIVVKVWHDRMVNLTVFDANGNQYSRTSVALLQDDDKPLSMGYYAEWMSYQKELAQKS